MYTLVRVAVACLFVVGPASASVGPAAATHAVAAAPSLEEPGDPFVHWDEREKVARERAQEQARREAQEAARTGQPGQSGNALAVTGFDVLGAATLGLLLFAVGLGLLRLSRPKRLAPAR